MRGLAILLLSATVWLVDGLEIRIIEPARNSIWVHSSSAKIEFQVDYSKGQKFPLSAVSIQLHMLESNGDDVLITTIPHGPNFRNGFIDWKVARSLKPGLNYQIQMTNPALQYTEYSPIFTIKAIETYSQVDGAQKSTRIAMIGSSTVKQPGWGLYLAGLFIVVRMDFI